jgi:branched-chain amino acid transport system permease protein
MSLMLDRQEAMTELPPGIDQPQAAELTADRVEVRFQGLAAISDISLTINRREIFGLIGPNGGGKALGFAFGGDGLRFTMTEMLIGMTVVIGIYMFIGNSGIMSFGHIAFMCIGAYAAAWATVDPGWKQIMLTGLPQFRQDGRFPFPAAVFGAGLLSALVAFVLGSAIMRLNGLAASIATFAFLAIVNSVYSNRETVTGGTSSIIGIPTVVDPWIAFIFAALAIVAAFAFQNWRVGLMLRASRDDEVAARSSAVNPIRVRLVAFVCSAFIVGVGGGVYAHFLGVLTTDAFYLSLSFVTLSMLVIGGIGSLTVAVVGTLAVTVIVEVLRACERGIAIGHLNLAMPPGSQEIGLGVLMALILVFRPSGITRSREGQWLLEGSYRGRRRRRRSRRPDGLQDSLEHGGPPG